MSGTALNASAPLLHRPAAVMEMLSIRQTTFWRLVKQGAIKTRKIGAATLIADEEVRRFVAGLPEAQ